MANDKQILRKIARNLKMLAIDAEMVGDTVVVSNGASNIVVSYVDAAIAGPVGGVDGNSNPFLGMGVSYPGQIKIASSDVAAATVADVLNSAIAAQVLAVSAGFANDMLVVDGSDETIAYLRGHADRRGLGM